MKLLIDVGNTRLKWALWDGAAVAPAQALDHAADLAPQLDDAWAALPDVDEVRLACVASAAVETTVAAAVRRRFGRAPRLARSRAVLAGVRCAYAHPEKFGIDRYLALVALHRMRPTATVLASVGTALTLDALGADGTHAGGLIAPGPALAQQALVGATARVRTAAQAALVEMADDTEAAVHSGCWLGAVALVERFHAQAARALGGVPRLILAGGDGALLRPHLAREAQYEPDLVLRGLGIDAVFAE
jgi:type III pantothenate kinase